MRRNLGTRTGRPVWLCTVGRLTDRGGAPRRVTWSHAKEVVGFQEAVHPRDHRFFSGAIDRDQLSAAQRLIFRGLGGSYGDFRNWQKIDAWAQSIARGRYDGSV